VKRSDTSGATAARNAGESTGDARAVAGGFSRKTREERAAAAAAATAQRSAAQRSAAQRSRAARGGGL
jgi:hypothetical protein